MKAYFETRIMIANGGLVLNGSIFVLQAGNGMVDNEFGVILITKLRWCQGQHHHLKLFIDLIKRNLRNLRIK
jgi:hypothetical protein